MINEKIDHHFNELSPIDFNIFEDTQLYKKLIKENVPYNKALALHNHITIIKEQIESLLNGEDEQLTVVYGFLTQTEQNDYLDFLKKIDMETKRYLQCKKTNKSQRD